MAASLNNELKYIYIHVNGKDFITPPSNKNFPQKATITGTA
jgi:hypothetical protein